MTDKVTPLVKLLFSQHLDVRVTTVESVSGRPPSAENCFLLNQALNQFQGVAKTQDKKFVFFIEKQGDRWKLDARQI